jgi:hypothetical protein
VLAFLLSFDVTIFQSQHFHFYYFFMLSFFTSANVIVFVLLFVLVLPVGCYYFRCILDVIIFQSRVLLSFNVIIYSYM